MAIQIDWSLLGRSPDVGAAFQEGYQGARRQAQQQATQDALAAYGANPGGPVPAALWSLDPQAAALVSKNSREVGAQAREARGRSVYADILRGGPSAQAAPVTNALAPTAATAAGSPTDANGDIVVTANGAL